MQTRALTVPKGKDVLMVWVSNHTHVLLRDGEGALRARSDSDGKHVSFTVAPGRYTLETDGRVRKIGFVRMMTSRPPARYHLERPPRPRR